MASEDRADQGKHALCICSMRGFCAMLFPQPVELRGVKLERVCVTLYEEFRWPVDPFITTQLLLHRKIFTGPLKTGWYVFEAYRNICTSDFSMAWDPREGGLERQRKPNLLEARPSITRHQNIFLRRQITHSRSGTPSVLQLLRVVWWCIQRC